MFPGAISLAIILASCFPLLFNAILPGSASGGTPPSGGALTQGLVLLAYLWLSLSMLVAWAGKLLEGRARLRWLAPVFIYAAGYGALLCAITLSAYIKEARRRHALGEDREDRQGGGGWSFEEALLRDRRNERRLLVREVLVTLLIAGLLVARALLL